MVQKIWYYIIFMHPHGPASLLHWHSSVHKCWININSIICVIDTLSFNQIFLMCFTNPNRVPRIENRVLKIIENYAWVPRIREIGSLQVHTRFQTFSL